MHFRFAGQAGERIERIQHLRGRPFEQPAATAGEQRVAAENVRRAARIGHLEIRDMATRVTGHVENGEIERGRHDVHFIALFEALRQVRNRFSGGAVDGHNLAIQQIGHSADVVGMMVRE